MKLSFYIFLFLTFYSVSAQDLKLEGRIIDKKTKQALPYSTVEVFSLKTGTIADSEGNFSLNLKSDIANFDSIRFSHLGYEAFSISITDFENLKEKTIALSTKDVLLSEVFVVPRNYKTMKLGVKDKKPEAKQITSYYNNKIGNFIENVKGEEGWLKSVSFYLHKTGHPQTPFRIGIYRFGKDSKGPEDNILNENIIVSAPKAGWFTVDMSKYNIRFPEEGFFVVMEWINSGENYFYKTKARTKGDNGEIMWVKRQFYGQSIGSVLRQQKAITWGVNLGDNWVQYKLFHKGYINAMINVDIAYSVD